MGDDWITAMVTAYECVLYVCYGAEFPGMMLLVGPVIFIRSLKSQEAPPARIPMEQNSFACKGVHAQ